MMAFVETGKVELNVLVPNLSPGAVIHVLRDMRRTLENCATINLLSEFVVTRIVEYKEEEAK